MPAEAIGLGADDRPGRPVVVEGTRREGEELLLLGVIQYPVEVPIVPEVGDERLRQLVLVGDVDATGDVVTPDAPPTAVADPARFDGRIRRGA